MPFNPNFEDLVTDDQRKEEQELAVVIHREQVEIAALKIAQNKMVSMFGPKFDTSEMNDAIESYQDDLDLLCYDLLVRQCRHRQLPTPPESDMEPVAELNLYKL